MTIAISPMNRQAASDAMYDKLGADYLCVHPSTLVVPEDRLRKIDPKTIPALADSFREVGQISPIGIKRIPGSPNYRVVYGARRALAMQLLLEEAIAKANDPNKDNDVHRFGSMHALVYRPETDDETCRELEIRENLDRKELTVKERTAHQLQLAACMKRRQHANAKNNGHVKKSLTDTGITVTPAKSKGGGNTRAPILKAVSDATGITPIALKGRVAAASKLVNMPANLDVSPPEVLDEVARRLLDGPRDEPITKNSHKRADGSQSIEVHLNPTRPAVFTSWVKKQYAKGEFTIDQIRAYRDALIALVAELEQQA